jgi:hypothetical protein
MLRLLTSARFTHIPMSFEQDSSAAVVGFLAIAALMCSAKKQTKYS